MIQEKLSPETLASLAAARYNAQQANTYDDRPLNIAGYLPEEGKKILRHLQKKGIEGRFVGGTVRDALLGHLTQDIDIAVKGDPKGTLIALKKGGYKADIRAIGFGTLTVYLKPFNFEITSLRKDFECDGRRTIPVFGGSFEEDAQRRDFTINALYADEGGNIFDPHNGYQDLLDNKIIFIGNPDERIKEDYLRILRFYRFNAFYGGKTLNLEGQRACLKNREGLLRLSKERILKELLRTLMAPNPKVSFSGLQQLDISNLLWGEKAYWEELFTLFKTEGDYQFQTYPLTRFYTWLPQGEGFWKKNFRFSSDQLKNLKFFKQYSDPPKISCEEIFYKLGSTRGKQVLLIRASQGLVSKNEVEKWLQDTSVPLFPLKGEDILNLGIKPGPQLGYVLKSCEEWWVQNHFIPSLEECLKFCEKLREKL